MLLIIPSIRIKDGHCIGEPKYLNLSVSPLHYEKPEDRARLLRKENAKALHLIFEDQAPWNRETLDLIERIRQAVDIPIQVSLSTIPENISCIKQIIESGIYRLFLPHNADDYFLTDCIHDFTRQKIVVSIPIESVTRDILSRLKNDGLIRISVALPDEKKAFPITQLQEIANMGQELGMRLSLLFGVYSFKELMQLSQMNPGYDSVILGSALDNNSFPCQGIWRNAEEKAYSSIGPEANLWVNPLEHVPHV